MEDVSDSDSGTKRRKFKNGECDNNRTVHEEAAKDETFDIVVWIRSRRLQWLGHILRRGRERQIKQAIFEMYKNPTVGDLLMDTPKTSSCRELCTYVMDREY